MMSVGDVDILLSHWNFELGRETVDGRQMDVEEERVINFSAVRCTFSLSPDQIQYLQWGIASLLSVALLCFALHRVV